MDTFIFIISILITAFAFAKLEIQIEGDGGWAKNLPTWRLSHESKWRIILGGRDVTGYHVWTHLFVLLLCHSVLLLSGWTLRSELFLVIFLIAFYTVEDFLWFVFNPTFGIRKFKKEYIPWHRDTWWLFMPRDYFVVIFVLGILIYILYRI
ncbi:MAG: hypothetical protein WCW14_03470 [Candidatus Paceibacterota bacterium]|jgi:hypothetical protein